MRTIFIDELSFLIQLNDWIKNRTKHFPFVYFVDTEILEKEPIQMQCVRVKLE